MATIGVAVLVAFLSGFAGAWIQVSHESRERIRDRMLFAADDYSTGVTQAMLALHDARGKLGEALRERTDGPAAEIDLAVVRERVDVVHSRLARVELLFGDETETGKSAGSALSRLRGVILELELGDYAAAGKQFDLAYEQHGAFNRAARSVMVSRMPLRA